ncbi:hypothetical protein [Salinibacillus xinjiangensis]|uniref:Uncharacterized protein n=1 Tax=Salinibacillus xinjiangensis TaxID=1229268 RepID=A0A6G1X878_9BACI|nr:hypothetical protein [Salinibacillus xinjiangensis]MRG87080.1 hypothetical protein [Salinibacillus xinjiangensis]
MTSFLLELSLFGLLIIALTAFSAVLVQLIGENLLGRKNKDKFTSRSLSIQSNWKQVGGSEKK